MSRNGLRLLLILGASIVGVIATSLPVTAAAPPTQTVTRTTGTSLTFRLALAIAPVGPIASSPRARAPRGPGPGSDAASASGGHSGFLFLLGMSALLAAASLFVPRLMRTLKRIEPSYAPQIFVSLLERPG